MYKLKGKLILFVLVFTGCAPALLVTEKHYEHAESYLQPNISKQVYHLHVGAEWLADSSGFWHVAHTREGKRFFLTDIETMSTNLIFDHEHLATLLKEGSAEEVSATDLPFNRIRFVNKNLITFRINSQSWEYDLVSGELSQTEPDQEIPGVSPNGMYQAFISDYNLFVRELETGNERQLSTNGRYLFEYANTYGWSDLMEGEGGKRPENLFVNWSPDSRKILTYITDLSHAEKMYLLDFSVDTLFRPRLLSYYRGSPGDTTVVYYHPVIFDLDADTETAIHVKPFAHFMGISFQWSDDAAHLYGLYHHRGFKQTDMIRVDAATGQVTTLFSDSTDTSLETWKMVMRIVGDDLLVVSSERNGWNHLYLYNLHSGELLNPISHGDYVVTALLHIDEENELAYFMAAGREAGRNPYYDHLYKVPLKGGEPELLTPENAHHQLSLSPCKRFVVDNYSRVDMPAGSVVRDLESGRIVHTVSRADAEDLLAKGWKPPMQFTVKARDGVTDIHGVIYKPSGFKPGKKYPVIDYTYTGPHTSATPRSFANAVLNIQNPLTAFGFIVVVIDGMGTSFRSKAFRDVSYMNMGYNLDCHVAAIRQLADRYKWIDIDRVGIYGHSAGGYDAGRALLNYPDFYKVGVASAADHDHRMEKAWWPEMYMGYPVGEFYHEQSNVTNAANLKGRLLIAHGAIDENVNPSATYKLAEYLIRAGKDFDMLILPGKNHSFGRSDGDYFTKIRWNYFIKHLLGAEPVLHYQFKTIE